MKQNTAAEEVVAEESITRASRDLVYLARSAGGLHATGCLLSQPTSNSSHLLFNHVPSGVDMLIEKVPLASWWKSVAADESGANSSLLVNGSSGVVEDLPPAKCAPPGGSAAAGTQGLVDSRS